MTDKEKIRKEVQRLMNELIQEKERGYGSDTDDACILELQNVLTYIDSLQEEPVAPKVLEDMLNAKTAAESLGISQEEHDRIVDELIYGKEPELVDVDDLPNKEEEPVSNDLEEAATKYARKQVANPDYPTYNDEYEMECAFEAGSQWQKEHLWKPADGDDLPEIDREVIVLYQRYPMENNEYAVGFGHRPPEFWDGRNIETDEVTRYYPKRYDKGGWNIPDVKFWLDYNIDELLHGDKK